MEYMKLVVDDEFNHMDYSKGKKCVLGRFRPQVGLTWAYFFREGETVVMLTHQASHFCLLYSLIITMANNLPELSNIYTPPRCKGRLPCCLSFLYIIYPINQSSILFHPGRSSRSSHSPATSSGLPLAVEVDGGGRQAEVVELGEVAGAEVLPPPWGVDRLPAELLEEQKHQAVDSEHRPWALVAHDLSPCAFKYTVN